MSQVVLVLDSVIDGAVLKSRLKQFMGQFPIVQGSIARDFNLAPYWKIPKKAEINLNFNFHNVSDEKDLLTLLDKCVNKPFKTNSEHLAFYLVNIGNQKSCLAMTFDHRLFDARGAESFLKLFQQYLNDNFEVFNDILLTAPAFLSEWIKKFYAGRNVNRKIVALSKTPPDFLPVPSVKNNFFKFKLISFNQPETRAIYDNAYREAGYLMEMTFLLSVVMHTVHKFFRRKGLLSNSYLIPVSIDMRTAEDIRQELFFNYVSYIFIQIHMNDKTTQKELIDSIKTQMYEQVKSGIPHDIMEASLLTRIAPLSLLKMIIDIPLNGKIASFCFSHVSKNPLSPVIMERKIENIFHMPRVPVPPGLGVFSNYFNGRLNLVISYLDGLVTDDEMILIEKGIREGLANE